MAKIFVDTGPLYSINNPNDQRFKETWELFKAFQGKRNILFTTDYIVDEAATTLLTRQKGGYPFAVNFLDWIFKTDSRIQIEWIGKGYFYKAKDIFKKFNKDKTWSFTDCASYVVMKELKIKNVFTFDDHFKQMGFEVL